MSINEILAQIEINAGAGEVPSTGAFNDGEGAKSEYRDVLRRSLQQPSSQTDPGAVVQSELLSPSETSSQLSNPMLTNRIQNSSSANHSSAHLDELPVLTELRTTLLDSVSADTADSTGQTDLPVVSEVRVDARLTSPINATEQLDPPANLQQVFQNLTESSLRVAASKQQMAANETGNLAKPAFRSTDNQVRNVPAHLVPPSSLVDATGSTQAIDVGPLQSPGNNVGPLPAFVGTSNVEFVHGEPVDRESDDIPLTSDLIVGNTIETDESQTGNFNSPHVESSPLVEQPAQPSTSEVTGREPTVNRIVEEHVDQTVFGETLVANDAAEVVPAVGAQVADSTNKPATNQSRSFDQPNVVPPATIPIEPPSPPVNTGSANKPATYQSQSFDQPNFVERNAIPIAPPSLPVNADSDSSVRNPKRPDPTAVTATIPEIPTDALHASTALPIVSQDQTGQDETPNRQNADGEFPTTSTPPFAASHAATKPNAQHGTQQIPVPNSTPTSTTDNRSQPEHPLARHDSVVRSAIGIDVAEKIPEQADHGPAQRGDAVQSSSSPRNASFAPNPTISSSRSTEQPPLVEGTEPARQETVAPLRQTDPTTLQPREPAVPPSSVSVQSATRQEINPTHTRIHGDAQQLIDQVATALRQVEQNGGQLRVRLHPPELGMLRIEVTVQNGLVSARLEVQTTSAQHALLENLAQLRDAVTQNATPVDRIEVHLAENRHYGGEPESEDGREQTQRDSTNRQSRQGNNSESDPDTESNEPDAEPQPSRRQLSMDRLDIQL